MLYRVLLCPPTHYDIEYEINPWMDITHKVDQKKVRAEYETLKQTYQKLGLEILEIEQKKGLPDMVYAANFGFPENNFFIKANFKFAERKKEAELAKQYFTNLGFTIHELPENVNWEGQGDLLKIGGKYFAGYGKRSDQKAKRYLEEILTGEIIDLELIDPYYYHLDTCFLPLNKQTVAINPLSFTAEGLAKIAQNFTTVIKVSQEDNQLLACNAVVVNKSIVVGKGISQQLKTDFKNAGFVTEEVAMDEYRKGGGSVKCLTLKFY
ncbi:MAG TPA: arginine deiminase-related protein [Patescibacteria group bacterium]